VVERKTIEIVTPFRIEMKFIVGEGDSKIEMV
jgi:hypothetical protein